MASSKDLRKRLTSVRNTSQITRAMKMVSAAKLRRAQDAILALRPFAREVQSVIAMLAHTAGAEFKHPLLMPKAQAERKKALVVVVSSDRGLCGGFNSSIFKAVQRFVRENQANYEVLDLAFIGKKGYEFFRNKKTGKYHADFFKGLKYTKTKAMVDELIEQYLAGEYDEIKFIYNEFKSAISQKVVVEDLLPVPLPADVAQAETLSAMTIYEPNAEVILDRLLSRHFATQAHRMLLESLASEHGARMTAMENATRNAKEMMRKIELEYNKSRQAAITKELLEIVAGAEAQKV